MVKPSVFSQTIKDIITRNPEKTQQILDELKNIRKESIKDNTLIKNIGEYITKLQLEELENKIDLEELEKQIELEERKVAKMSKFKKSKRSKLHRKTSRKSPAKPRRKSNRKKL